MFKKTPETVLSKVVQWYLVSMCDSSTVKQPWLRGLSALWMTSYHITSLGISVCIVTRSSIFAVTDLVSKMQGIVWCCIQLTHLLWWWKRALLRDVLQEVTELMYHVQVPVEPHIRRKMIAQCEARHKIVKWTYESIGLLVLMAYLIPPIFIYVTDSSADKILPLPIGMCDPFSTRSLSDRCLLYLLATFCFCSLNYVAFQNLLLHALFFDSLKTLYHLNGLAFLRLGDTIHDDCIRSAIKFHQRVCRLSSKMKILIEPVIALTVCTHNIYHAMCGLGAIQFSSGMPVFMGASVIVMVPLFLEFSIPAETTLMAEQIADCVYFNDNWVACKFRPATFFPLIIMRANRRLKFRMFNFWVLSMENFIQYLKGVSSFFVLLQSITSRSQKA